MMPHNFHEYSPESTVYMSQGPLPRRRSLRQRGERRPSDYSFPRQWGPSIPHHRIYNSYEDGDSDDEDAFYDAVDHEEYYSPPPRQRPHQGRPQYSQRSFSTSEMPMDAYPGDFCPPIQAGMRRRNTMHVPRNAPYFDPDMLEPMDRRMPPPQLHSHHWQYRPQMLMPRPGPMMPNQSLPGPMMNQHSMGSVDHFGRPTMGAYSALPPHMHAHQQQQHQHQQHQMLMSMFNQQLPIQTSMPLQPSHSMPLVPAVAAELPTQPTGWNQSPENIRVSPVQGEAPETNTSPENEAPQEAPQEPQPAAAVPIQNERPKLQRSISMGGNPLRSSVFYPDQFLSADDPNLTSRQADKVARLKERDFVWCYRVFDKDIAFNNADQVKLENDRLGKTRWYAPNLTWFIDPKTSTGIYHPSLQQSYHIRRLSPEDPFFILKNEKSDESQGSSGSSATAKMMSTMRSKIFG